MILRTAVVLIALLVSSSAQANYLMYQSWLATPAGYRAAYIAGAYDSFIGVWYSGGAAQEIKAALHYSDCLKRAGMRAGQLATNVMNFAKDKPELQVGSVQDALIGYLIAACGKPPTQ